MKYVKFYIRSTGYVPGSIPPRFDDAYKLPIEACGDRGVIIVDGRLSPENIRQLAIDHAMKYGYIGYKVFKGESFTRSSAISEYWPVPSQSEDKTVYSATHGA